MSRLSVGNQRDQDLWYRYAEMAKWNLIQLKQHKEKNKTYLINLHSQGKENPEVSDNGNVLKSNVCISQI